MENTLPIAVQEEYKDTIQFNIVEPYNEVLFKITKDGFYFYGDNKELLRIEMNGSIYRNQELIDNNKQIAEGFLEFLNNFFITKEIINGKESNTEDKETFKKETES